MFSFCRAGVAMAAALIGLTACTAAASHPSSSPPSTRVVTVTRTPSAATTSTPTSLPTGALSTGPITTTAADCPLIPEANAADTLGQRLARVTVQSTAGRVVGCEFFDVQGTALAASEHLSGPNQPALQISSARYASATLAHNAMVRTAEAGVNAHPSGAGLAYQTSFDPIDGANHDWAFAFATGPTLVIVRTNESDSELDAEGIGTALGPKF